MELEIQQLKNEIERLNEIISKLRLENSSLETKLYTIYGKL